MPKSKTFTLYLAKSGVEDFERALTQAAQDRVSAKDATVVESDGLGSKAIAYIFDNEPRSPPWLSDIGEVFDGLPAIKNKSSCAVVVFKHAKRIFITSFAHGWQYIDDSRIESDFGLRVAVNSLSDSKLRRIDRSHLGEAMKGVSQSAFQRDLQAFGIDEALDLVRRITGKAEDSEFANSIAGSTSLKITREMTLPDLAGIAEEALTRFQSDAYKKTSFQIIDKVRPILDQALLMKLDAKAIEVIKAGQDSFELALPGWSEDDVVYYGFSGLRVQRRYPDLLMSNYRTELGDDIGRLDIDCLHKHGVIAEFASDAMIKKRWSLKKALIGSLVIDNGLYAISEGEWYRLDQQFKDDVDGVFHELVKGWDSTPLKIIKKVSEDGKRTGFESELEYNKRCASYYGQLCLDQEILPVVSIPYGKFESCDLIDIAGKRLIHVKKSSRQSSVLSHFFKQGSNSARILKTYPEARQVLLERVRALSNGAAAEHLRENLGDTLSGWTVEFHIIDAPRPNGSFAIPFFSRITLREEARTLRGMTFGVVLRFIPT
ncbi:hypothetical protein CXZ10_11285 [Pleomorphomonas diazotrophica]|uniref:Sporadically distributed protein, TIGR04141 family n=1 Tax=Pleomorphomonas diazotrophica TaxID=1166257 RepID=A0A1I4WIP7_9HYPH|nr:DUF6119 family protein [Pleomorphomonas diazotrophica]PKR89092.1 hypothetical protein CXZ10_11285 [Pleomorphomonas diazotrophica]SFN13285.1 sporadically distributed protein, TIGR04141 family [Pleomorphomonas diazotrophica]